MLIVYRLALVLALLLVPVAAAQTEYDTPNGEPLCIIIIEPSEDWRRVRVTVDLILDEDQMEEYQRAVDQDGDGTTTVQEVTSWQEASRHNMRPQEMGNKTLMLDNRHAYQIDIHTNLIGFEGATYGQRHRIVQEIREFHFSPTESPRHTITGGRDYVPEPPQVVVEFVILKAPRDFAIGAVEYSNGTMFFEPQERPTELEIVNFQTKQPYSITYHSTQPVESYQGAAIWSAIAGTILLAAVGVIAWRMLRR